MFSHNSRMCIQVWSYRDNKKKICLRIKYCSKSRLYPFPSFQNPIEPETVENGKFLVDPEEVLEAEKMKKDYASFPALAGPPRIGDKIAYRVSSIVLIYVQHA